MFDISTVKAQGRAAFKANYWPSVIVAFIYVLFFVGIVTLGLGLAFWTAPYTQSANAALYLELTRR